MNEFFIKNLSVHPAARGINHCAIFTSDFTEYRKLLFWQQREQEQKEMQARRLKQDTEIEKKRSGRNIKSKKKKGL